MSRKTVVICDCCGVVIPNDTIMYRIHKMSPLVGKKVDGDGYCRELCERCAEKLYVDSLESA